MRFSWKSVHFCEEKIVCYKYKSSEKAKTSGMDKRMFDWRRMKCELRERERAACTKKIWSYVFVARAFASCVNNVSFKLYTSMFGVSECESVVFARYQSIFIIIEALIFFLQLILTFFIESKSHRDRIHEMINEFRGRQENSLSTEQRIIELNKTVHLLFGRWMVTNDVDNASRWIQWIMQCQCYWAIVRMCAGFARSSSLLLKKKTNNEFIYSMKIKWSFYAFFIWND